MVRIPVARQAALCALASAAACRIHFDPVPDAGTGVCPPTPACTSGAWMPAPLQPFDSVTSRTPNEETEWSGEISCDGLRLVYATALGRRADSVYVARRSRLTDPFGPPELQQFPMLSDAREPSFRKDDLEIYFTSDVGSGANARRCLHVARREHTGDAWGSPKRILDCSTFEFRGPSLSHDGLRLYYDQDDAGSVTIMMTSRPAIDTEFDAPGAPVMWAGSPGGGFCALSSDELTIYCEDGNPSQLVQSVRTSRDAAFTSVTSVPGIPALDSRGKPFGYSDPSVSGDGRLLVYASTPDGGDANTSFQHLRLAERSCP